MKLSLASAAFLLAAIASAYPAKNANGGNSASTGATTNANSGNSNTGASTNANSGSKTGASTNAGNSTTSAQGSRNSAAANTNGGSTNANSGNTNANGGNTNANGGNTNANGNGGNTNVSGGTANVDNPQVQDGNNDQNPFGNVDQQTAQLMQTAVNDWMRDTGVVSNFLNIGPTITDETTFRNQAQIAHSAEVDELTHKAVLDQFMPNNKNVANANATLSNGAFQLVVDRLDDMARQGFAQKNGIDDINKDRCVNVLPNIDAYMREAALTIGNGQGIQQSVRPAACANVVAGQNGALQVNQIPPGYVNGKLQNGNSNLNPNIATTPADDDSPEINLAGGGGTTQTQNGNGNNGANTQGTQQGQGQATNGNGNNGANTQGTQQGQGQSTNGNSNNGANTQGTQQGQGQNGANTGSNTQAGQGASSTNSGARPQASQGASGTNSGARPQASSGTASTQSTNGGKAGGASANGASSSGTASTQSTGGKASKEVAE